MAKKKKSSTKKSQDETSQDETSQDETSQDDGSEKTENKKESTIMSRTVKVKKNDDAPENVFNLGESIKPGQKYHLAKGGDGLHFKTLESVKTYFERRYKGHQVTID